MANPAVSVLSDFIATQNVTVSGSLNLKTTSSFAVSDIVTSSVGIYDVDVALHTIDKSLEQFNINIANAVGGVINQYNSRRFIYTGSLDSNGFSRINLTDDILSGSTFFSTASLYNISLDFLIDSNGDDRYKNDIVSYQIYESSSKVYVDVEAASATNINYRLLVVNEESIEELPNQDGFRIIAGPQGPQGIPGIDGKSYITVASSLSTTNTINTVASNFSLNPTKAPNGFYIDITGFTVNNSYPMVVSLYDLSADTLLSSGTINYTIPSTLRLSGSIPAINNNQYELRYYSSGSSNNYVYLQTAIVEI